MLTVIFGVAWRGLEVLEKDHGNAEGNLKRGIKLSG